jgi:DNA-binding XRE family transcriptional regulator
MLVADGQRLRQLRRESGLSQEMLADQAGISRTTIGRLERQGGRSCRGRTLARLAAVLGQDTAALTPMTDQPARRNFLTE